MKKVLWFVGVLIVGLGGCSGMKLQSIKPVSKQSADYKKEKDGVEVRVHKLDKRECPLKKYKACILTVHNKGIHKLRVKESAFRCELPDEGDIYEVLSKSVGRRVMSACLLGLGLSVAAIDGGACRAGLEILSILSSIPLGVNASSYNDQLQLYLEKYMFKGFSLSPGNKKTRIVFISASYANGAIPFTPTRIIKSSDAITKEKIEFNLKI